MEVNVSIQRRTKPMNKGDRTQSSKFRRIWTARVKRLLHVVQKNPQDTVEQVSILGEKVPQPFRKG